MAVIICLLNEDWSDPNWFVIVGVCTIGWLVSTIVGGVYWRVRTTKEDAKLTPGRTGKRLLDRLSKEEYAHLAPSLTSASMDLKHVIHRANEPIHDIYFPTTAVCPCSS